MKKKYLLIFIFLLISSSSISSNSKKIQIITITNKEYISLFDFIKIFDVNNSFNIISQRGKIYYKNNVAVYQIGFSNLLINGILKKSEYPIKSYRGEILLPINLFKTIAKNFYPNIKIKKEEHSLYCQIKPEASPTKKIDSINKKTKKKITRKTTKDRIKFIVIDPGHGGKDPGAIGKGGVKEKWITLKVSKLLKKHLKKKLKNIKIFLTRKSDKFIELKKRIDFSNKLLKKSDNGIFVSIHTNASISKKISGFETYFLSQNPTNDEARTTAALENNVIVLENKPKKNKFNDIDYIEALMITTQIQKESSMLSDCIQKEMDKKIWEFKSKGVKKADFFVLRGSMMPSVLVEIGFITNIKEGKYLQRNSYQKKISRGIGDGIIKFITNYNKMLKK